MNLLNKSKKFNAETAVQFRWNSVWNSVEEHLDAANAELLSR